MKRRLLIVYDYDSDESGFIVVDVTKPLAKGTSYGAALEAKRLLELEGERK